MMTTTELHQPLHPPMTMHAPPGLVPRVRGMLRLDPATAREIARSDAACAQAVLIVLGVAITRVIVSDTGVLAALMSAFGVWILGSLLIATLGPMLIGTPTSRQPSRRATLRLLGFAQAPMLLALLGVIDPLAGPAGIAAWVLTWVTTAFAVRLLLGVSWTRAVIAALAARLVIAIPLGVLGLLLAIGDGIVTGH
jgi:hypothetical protein